MSITVAQDDATPLAEYARVPIGFMVTEVFDEPALAALVRGDIPSATPVLSPYWKDYDSHPGNRPTDWPNCFDTSRWTILTAYDGETRVGGAVVVHDDPRMEIIANCPGCAVFQGLLRYCHVGVTGRGHLPSSTRLGKYRAKLAAF